MTPCRSQILQHQTLKSQLSSHLRNLGHKCQELPEGLSNLKAATFLCLIKESPSTHLMLPLYLQSRLKSPMEQDILEQTFPACSPPLAALGVCSSMGSSPLPREGNTFCLLQSTYDLDSCLTPSQRIPDMTAQGNQMKCQFYFIFQ